MSLTHDLSSVAAPQLTIDGETVTSPGQIEVINPATAQVFVAVPDAGAAELDRAADAARRAGRAWRAVPLEQRQDYLRELVAVIRTHIDELALYDVVNTPGVAADLSHISSPAVRSPE